MAPTLTARVLPKFPTRVANGPGVQVTKANGTWTIGLDTANLGELPVSDPANTYVAVQLPDGTYAKVPMDEVLSGQIIAGVYQSAAIVQGLSIPTVGVGGPQAIETLGYATPGDGGDQIYSRVGSGAAYGSIQSADGQWWAPSVGVTNEAFYSNASSNPTRTQPVFVKNSRSRWFIGTLSGVDPTRVGPPPYGWLVSANGPSWIPRDSQFCVMPEVGAYAISSVVRRNLAQQPDPPTFNAPIAAAFFATNQEPTNGAVWGQYIEVQVDAIGTNAYDVNASGIELNVRNAGAINAQNPYNLSNGSAGASGISLAGGGDPQTGPVTINPSNYAFAAFRNGTYPFGAFFLGLGFSSTSLDGTDGSDSSVGTGTAIAMARNHEVRWYASNSQPKVRMWSSVTSAAGIGWQQEYSNTSLAFRQFNGQPVFTIAQVASGVNYLTASGAAAGAPVLLSAAGTDADVDIRLIPKGLGMMRFGANSASGDAPINGFISIKDQTGAVRKLATIA